MKNLLEMLMQQKFDIRVVAFFVILLFIILSDPNYNLIVCNSQDQPCTVYANTFGIKRSKTFLSPSHITSFKTEYYREPVFRSSSSNRGYKLMIVSTDKRRHELFDYRYEWQARTTGENLINCIAGKHYPCEISKF